MNPHTLAKALRRRQLRAGLVPKELVHRMNDMEILACYLLCSKCNGDIFRDATDRAAAVENAKNVQEFLTWVDMELSVHQCKNRN